MVLLKKKTVLVLGTARSGTTWLARMLATPFRYRLLFEPFHVNHIEDAYLVADRYYQEHPPINVINFCTNALSDNINSDWIRQSVTKNKILRKTINWTKVIICKDIRSNLFIPTYKKLYGDSLKIVVIIRNPFDVIESMLRAKFPWTWDIHTLLNQNEFAEQYNIPINKLKPFQNSFTGIYMVRWIIENSFLIKNPNLEGVHIHFYEKLKKDPNSQYRNICLQVGIDPMKNITEFSKLPSPTTHKNSLIFSSKDSQPRLSQDQQSTIRNIMEIAELEYPQ